MKTYAFRIRSGTEFKAQAALTALGLIGMVPVRYEFRRVGRKDGVKNVQAIPQLPGYFAALVPDDVDWYAVMTATYRDTGERILRAPLSYDGELRPLDPLSVLQIRQLQGLEPEAPQIGRIRGIEPGDTVIIRDGVHAGKRIRVQKVVKDNTKGQTIAALMLFLGTLREVNIDGASVDLVDAA